MNFKYSAGVFLQFLLKVFLFDTKAFSSLSLKCCLEPLIVACLGQDDRVVLSLRYESRAFLTNSSGRCVSWNLVTSCMFPRHQLINEMKVGDSPKGVLNNKQHVKTLILAVDEHLHPMAAPLLSVLVLVLM
jgi:hypothetical protein